MLPAGLPGKLQNALRYASWAAASVACPRGLSFHCADGWGSCTKFLVLVKTSSYVMWSPDIDLSFWPPARSLRRRSFIGLRSTLDGLQRPSLTLQSTPHGKVNIFAKTSVATSDMDTLPTFVRRSLQTAFELRNQFYDQVEEAQDVVQDVTDFIVHSKVNKKVGLTPVMGSNRSSELTCRLHSFAGTARQPTAALRCPACRSRGSVQRGHSSVAAHPAPGEGRGR